jgi:hypothetical protein
MYGTIFNLKVKNGHAQLLIDYMKELESPEGMVAWFLMDPDVDRSDWIGVAVFKDKESHISNAKRPQQHENFMEMMKHLDEEPTWTDGTYVIGNLNCDS